MVFDLDDTLMNTGARTVKIAHEYVDAVNKMSKILQEEAKISPEYPLLAKVSIHNVQYKNANTIAAVGIVDPAVEIKFTPFWEEKFFSNAYCKYDLPIEGGAEYVMELFNAKAIIVYLTGRDSPRMEEGTRAALLKSGFPLDDKKALLKMKPKHTTADMEFKTQAFKTIKTLGHVVGAFENEPENVNAYLDEFPKVKAVFLDTKNSQDTIPVEDAIAVDPDVHWVKTLLGPWSPLTPVPPVNPPKVRKSFGPPTNPRRPF